MFDIINIGSLLDSSITNGKDLYFSILKGKKYTIHTFGLNCTDLHDAIENGGRTKYPTSVKINEVFFSQFHNICKDVNSRNAL